MNVSLSWAGGPAWSPLGAIRGDHVKCHKPPVCSNTHKQKALHTLSYEQRQFLCVYNTKSSCNMWNYTLTHTHTHTRHKPDVMHHLESGERRWASAGKYWKYLFLSTDERDVILQIYLVVLWICCRLICMTTHHLSLRARRQLRRLIWSLLLLSHNVALHRGGKLSKLSLE